MRKVIMPILLAALTGCATSNQSQPVLKVSDGTPVKSSWYQSGTHTANGERFRPDGLTVAHRTLPFGTKVQLTNPKTGDTVIATVNDRGPFTKNMSLDVSRGVAKALRFMRDGVTTLYMKVVTK